VTLWRRAIPAEEIEYYRTSGPRSRISYLWRLSIRDESIKVTQCAFFVNLESELMIGTDSGSTLRRRPGSDAV
jgi:hypothetical protein